MTEQAKQSLTIRRTFTAKQEDVFRAFQSAEAISQWFSPSIDISVEVIDFVFEPGGKFRFRYNMPDGTQSAVGGIYQKIDIPTELLFSWVWEEPDEHAGVSTIVHIQFIDRGANTEMILTHDKLSTPENKERHALGWDGTLNRLSCSLEESPK